MLYRRKLDTEEFKMDEKELLKRIDLMINEEIALRKEINILNENIERKDEIICGLSEIIMNTDNEEFIKLMESVMIKANFGDKVHR
jgi:hypothetical protein